MKKLLKKSFAFILLILLLGTFLNFFLPKNTYWGNREYAWKLKQYKKDKYNAVMFGTSRIYRGVNPLTLDSLMNQNSTTQPIKSFNLATHASWLNETLYLYDQFLNDSTLYSGIETVYMEFQNVMSINPKKLMDEKIIYYQNLNHYQFISKYSFYEVLRDPKKIITSTYSLGVFSFVSFVNLTNMKRISIKLNTKDLPEQENINERGYLSYADQVGEGTTEQGIRSFTDNIKLYLHQEEMNYNPIYYEKMMQLIEKSQGKGIKLVFILPPVRLTKGMMAVFNALPDEHKVEVCDPARFPELYNKQHWIDPVHLNKRGSDFLTAYLFQELKKLKK